MKKIAIIGVGLIGGSLGMALKQRASGSYHITGIGRNEKKLALAKGLKAIDDFTTDLAAGVREADIVVIGTPVDYVAKTVNDIFRHLKKGAIITDVGSIKGKIVKDVAKVTAKNRKGISFVGGHPMAGSEKNGVAAARADLFDGATVVLTMELASPQALQEIRQMWEIAGARVTAMTAAKHDRAVAFSSHLPHVLAFSLCSAVGMKDNDAAQLIAGSFKDMTRVADSEPRDWAAICSSNAREVGAAIEEYIKILRRAKLALRTPATLEKQFTAAREARKRLVRS